MGNVPIILIFNYGKYKDNLLGKLEPADMDSCGHYGCFAMLVYQAK
jgi:hypothetical protein